MLRLFAFLFLVFLPTFAVADPGGLIRVIDADTWDVGGQRVRLFGIDAPEIDQPCQDARGETWDCGKWASAQVRARFDGQQATCRKVTRDRYLRIVARCRVAGQDVGRVLVQNGWAFAYRQYSMDYDLDEKTALVQGVGLHAGKVQRPDAFRAGRVAAPAQRPPDSCVIKGNISSRDERIYHLPGQENYARTRISPRKGERWFCTEAEARAAGWRRAAR
ncbi:thermonuclease family protein [Arenibacterium sp. CAU 1754]